MIKTDKDELLIGIMSDTHVPHRAAKIPEIVINAFKKSKVDYILHLGDFTSYETYKQLIDTFGKDTLIAIRGNMDFDSNLKNLPEKIEMELYGKKVLILHGMGGPNMIIKRLIKKLDLLNSDYNIVIFGHTHRPVNEKQNGILFLNPGTTTPIDNKFTVISSFGFLRISKERVEFEVVYL
ncbi:MAG: metallophosphoesterase family protein [Candidatus Heimdallarchaeota archaeon]